MATKEQVIQHTDTDTKYAYVLPVKNEKKLNVYDEAGRRRPEPEYKPRMNLLTRSSILWPAKRDANGKVIGNNLDPWSGKERAPGRYPIRYYDGCTTLFIDDQPKDKETLEQFTKQTRELFFLNGYLYCYGYDVILKTYLDWASWNGNSPYRVPNIEIQYIAVDSERAAKMESENLDKMEEAMMLARKADVKKMRSHGKFLGILSEDYVTNIALSDEAYRTEYRKVANTDAKRFVDTYNDKSVQVTTWVEQALETGEISTTIIPNKAVWAKKGSEICDMSGIKSKEGQLNKLIEFSQTEAGEEFYAQLEGIYG